MGLFNWLFGNGKKDLSTEQPRRSDRPSPAISPRNSTTAAAPQVQPSKTSATRPKARVVWREDSWPLDTVGESHYQDNLITICGPYRREGGETEVRAVLCRDPNNPHDKNAIRVEVDGLKVGHIPREQAKRLSEQMREDGIDRAECGARIRGGWRTNQHDEGFYGVKLAVPARGWVDFGLGKEAPKPPERPKPASTGPLKGKKLALIGAPSTGDLAQELAGLGATIMARSGKTSHFAIIAEGADTQSDSSEDKWEIARAQSFIDKGAALKILTIADFRKTQLPQSTVSE